MTARSGEPHIELIVEGKADLNAVPVLLRKHLHERGEYRDILGKPIALHGVGNATKADGIEGFVSLAANRPGCVGVLVILDSDDECVVEMASGLLSRLQGLTSKPVVIALAVRTYEDWLFSSIETLDIGEVEYKSDAKGIRQIEAALKGIGESYSKPLWQPRLTHKMEISRARERSSCLARMLDRFDSLVELIPA